VEGQNLVLDYRFGEGRYDHLPSLAAELVQLKPDVIVASGSASTRAAKQATATIPIVMVAVGNVVPKASRIAVPVEASFLPHVAYLRDSRVTAQALGVNLLPIKVHGANDFDSAFSAI
jgi:putative tryptophan/tyrosine transport system substrate-binding protein